MSWAQYGTAHRREAEKIKATAVGKLCRRCGREIKEGQLVDAGHLVDKAIDPNSAALAPEHARKGDCSEGGNRSAGARLGKRLAKFNPSRQW